MKIAVTSTGADQSSAVDARFGRAPWLHVFDTDSGEHTAIDNTANAQGRSGVGVTTAQRVADAGADVVLTGRLGPNAQRVLEGSGIKVVLGVDGTVRAAVDSYTDGR
ncbi:MAG: dinitrogenase iron-molybdenum cofactor biosynthesis protein [Candidatus Eisenbacteria bacterium]|nr:dinitrogenase iron-molybdenum cofactor biosynthesis protein [Candidatus Eisenbacteria bacterium]